MFEQEVFLCVKNSSPFSISFLHPCQKRRIFMSPIHILSWISDDNLGSCFFSWEVYACMTLVVLVMIIILVHFLIMIKSTLWKFLFSIIIMGIICGWNHISSSWWWLSKDIRWHEGKEECVCAFLVVTLQDNSTYHNKTEQKRRKCAIVRKRNIPSFHHLFRGQGNFSLTELMLTLFF